VNPPRTVPPRALLAAQWERLFAVHPELRALTPTFTATLDSHGDSPGWFAHLAALPSLETDHVDLGPTLVVGRADECSAADQQALTTHLMALQPWRKGPFSLFGVAIDAEWRSDWKWQRVAPHVTPLHGRRVLDVGCGNGYYGWRMCAAGAAMVVGCDPTPLYVMQYLAVLRYLNPARPDLCNVVLPARLDDLPSGAAAFDTVFSMGVLYHRKDPGAHLRELRDQLRPGGELVLETLIVTGEPTLVPTGRYARMRNVRSVPDPGTLLGWVTAAGFGNAHIVDVTPTTVAEQRSTAWMPGESLAAALDPADQTRTVEGLPAPLRCVAIAVK
jgi:tRNA (mo5U34)-methyltransferase